MPALCDQTRRVMETDLVAASEVPTLRKKPVQKARRVGHHKNGDAERNLPAYGRVVVKSTSLSRRSQKDLHELSVEDSVFSFAQGRNDKKIG